MVCWVIRVGSCLKEKRLRPHLFECRCPQNNTHHVPKRCADEGSKNTVILEVCVTKFATSLVLPSKNDGGHHTPKSLSENLSRLCRDRFAFCRKICRKSVGICRKICRKSVATLAVLSCIKEKSTKTRVLTNPRFELILKIIGKSVATLSQICRNLSQSVANLSQSLSQVCRGPAGASP